MFSPVETSIGAILLHQATSNLLYQNGNVLGVSGFLRQLFTAPTRETIAFFIGMAASYMPLKALAPQSITSYPAVPMTLQAALVTIGVGVVIGLGTKMSNGCTSGHMLCGLARSSGRSTVAVTIFFPVAMLTHHLAHPTLYTAVCPGDVPCYMPVYPTATTAVSLVMLATLSILAARTVPKLVENILATHTNTGKQSFDACASSARQATHFFSGLLFALGLHISQMSHPAKVTSFLSFPSMQHWDPSLALVILFGVLPNFIETQLRGFSIPPAFAEKFSLPTKTVEDIDSKFVAGAMAFGVGWGLTGTCPGPAVLRALAQPLWGALWIGGFWLGGRVMS